jgi:N-acetylglucosaminyltransferase
VVRADVAALTLTIIVPAHNEEAGLPATLEALLKQTMPPDRVVVVDDGSSDGTAEIAAGYPVEVVCRNTSSGSKSRALNHVLGRCDTDIVMNVDADTIIGPDFVKRIKEPFTDPGVAVAAGMVQVWNPRGIIQRGRQIEYLFSQHLCRPLQHMWASPTVCPGAACAYRWDLLATAGGFPDDTIAEDMDYTWRAMIAGHRAVYVAGAECYVNDPRTPMQLSTQLWRWTSGYFQCVRLHWREICRHKKILALLVLASMWDIVSVPLWLATPFLLVKSAEAPFLRMALIAEALVTVPVIVTGAFRRGFSPLWALANMPFLWVNRVFSVYYSSKAMIWELVLVPLGWKRSLAFFHKGH